MKLLHKILALFFIILLLIFGIIYDSFNIAPKRIVLRNESVSSTRIPESINNINILFFSDIYFGEFMKIDRFENLANKIKNSGADVIIFLGDFFSSTYINNPSNEDIERIKFLLKDIKAPLGKFAIYGDIDHSNIDLLNDIYDYSDFEILNNKSIKLRNKSSQSINLVGLDSEYMGNPDINLAYENIPLATYTITLSHTPDTVLKVPSDKTDLFLSGHSLAGQAFYIFDSLYKPDYTLYYSRGKHRVENKINLDITSGTGTTIKDVRFLTNSEVVMYRLKHIKFNDSEN